jgi:hypothetical protein
MKKYTVKTIGRFSTKTFKTLLITGSFLILAWIAYCLSLITSDWLNWSADNNKDEVEIELLKC